MLLAQVYHALVEMWQLEIYETDEIKSVSQSVSYIRELLDTIGAGVGDPEYERGEEQDSAERMAEWEQEQIRSEQKREQEQVGDDDEQTGGGN